MSLGIIGSAYNAPAGVVLDGLTVFVDAFDEASYPGTGTTWYDLSGLNHDGSMSDVVKDTEGMKVTYAGLEPYVNFTHPLYSTAYTVGIVFKQSSWLYQEHYGATLIASSVGAGGYPIWLKSKDSALHCGAFSTSTTAMELVSSSGVISLDEWYHVTVAAVRGGESRLYVNGVLIASGTTGIGTVQSQVTVGSLRPNRGLGFDGHIGEFRMYDRVLSPEEVAQNFNAIRGEYGL